MWFAISWGSLPLLAGYVIQTNSISEISIIAASIACVISYLEIRISRVYKELRRGGVETNRESKRLEYQLKVISLGTILFGLFCVCLKYFELF
jgi:undecaprenyl pyrophosphate phosphatase UppP